MTSRCRAARWSLLIVLVVSSGSSTSPADDAFWNKRNEELRLLDYLQKKSESFGTIARPVLHHQQNVTLWYGLRLIQVDADEASNTLTTSVWIRHKWFDQNMMWNQSVYNVRTTTVPASWLWKPSLSLVNT